MQNINKLLKKYVKADDKILLMLLFALLPFTGIYYLINAQGAQFTGISFISTQFWMLLPIMTLLFGISIFSRELSPRVAFVTWTYTMYYFIVMMSSALIYTIELTPFHPVDFTLVNIDQLLGFHQLAWLNWTYAHPFIRNFINQCYGLMGFELAAVPMILGLLMQKRAVRVLFMSLIISLLIGTAIYYFFPTTAPASMFYDPHFALQQHDTYIKFYQIHHYLKPTTDLGGLIAFPSFHVIWATLLAYSFRHKKYLFYPIALFNAIIILSTLMLGWHYLVDVLGGLVLAGASILVAEYIHKKYIAHAPIVAIKTLKPTYTFL